MYAPAIKSVSRSRCVNVTVPVTVRYVIIPSCAINGETYTATKNTI